MYGHDNGWNAGELYCNASINSALKYESNSRSFPFRISGLPDIRFYPREEKNGKLNYIVVGTEKRR
jgi:hypothetical protein